MKKFSYENQGANTFLVYSVNEENGVDPVSLGMLTNNRIPGMAKVLFMQMDKSKIIKYNISSKVTLKQFFSGIVNKAKLLSVFTSIVETVLSAEDYMIDIKTIIMDSEYVFIDTRTGELSLICVPVNDSSEVWTNPSELFKNIMFSTSFDQTENCDYVAKIINYVNSTQNFSFANFRMLIDSLRTGTHSATSAPPSQVHIQEQKSMAQTVVNTHAVQQQVITQQQPIIKQEHSAVQADVAVPQKKVEDMTQDQVGEKEITMLDLLMHYSKENAEKYKAQKSSKQSSITEKSKSSIIGNLFTVPGKTETVKNESKPQSKAMKGAGFEIPGQTPVPISTPPTVQKSSQTTVQKEVQQEKSSAISSMPVYQTQSAPKEQNMNFGETTVLGGGVFGETTLLNETTVLGQQKPRINAYLIRYRNKEKIIINKPVFRIGKERSYVDYFIGDNTTISRSHANIINRDDEFYIVDTNSTNHTYVDGSLLQSNVETKLANGCKIRLANEDFEFKIY